MSKQINTTNWEVEFDRRWFKVKLDTIMGKDGLLVFDRESLSQLEPIKDFIKDLLASSQKDKEEAVEANTQEIFKKFIKRTQEICDSWEENWHGTPTSNSLKETQDRTDTLHLAQNILSDILESLKQKERKA